MKVVVYEINKGQKSHYFGLKTLTGEVLHSCPNNYRTIAGICKWAFRNGFFVVDIDN